MDPRRGEGHVGALGGEEVTQVEDRVEGVDCAAAVGGQRDVADGEVREEGGHDFEPEADAVGRVDVGCAAEAWSVWVDYADLVFLC